MQDGAHIRKESAKSPGNSSKTDEYFDIAVLDFGFDSTKSIYKKFIKFPIMRSFRYDQNILGSSSAESTHGSICATTITNTFPNSQLYLINFDTELEFLRALRYCVDTLQIRVISCSVSWMQAYDHYDGTSKLWHTIDKIIKDKSFLVISSGNFAQAHWEGHYTDANGDMSHDFNTNRSPLMVALKEGISYNFLLSWNEWNNPQTDLNLRIVDSHGNQLMSPAGIAYSSENRQTCGEYVRPVERISNLKVYAPGITKIYVDIFSNSQTITNDTKIHFELYQYPPPQESVPKAHRKSCLASGLATSRSESVVIVGASNVSYSSQGATNDGRTRPDFIASGVADYMGKNYSGTSFATCRVAAAFAKVLYRNPTWSLSNAMDLLKKNVLGKKNRSKDTVQGWGEIDFEKLNLSIHW
jgi:hypothetical protein